MTEQEALLTTQVRDLQYQVAMLYHSMGIPLPKTPTTNHTAERKDVGMGPILNDKSGYV